MVRTVLIVLLFMLLIGLLPVWPYSTGVGGWGYSPSGVLGLILIVVIVLALLGKI